MQKYEQSLKGNKAATSALVEIAKSAHLDDEQLDKVDCRYYSARIYILVSACLFFF